MKIISNFKDYYDFLQGKYGIDEKVVYERICQEFKHGHGKENPTWEKSGLFKPSYMDDYPYYSDNIHGYLLAICGVQYFVFYYRKKFYFGSDGVSELLKLNITHEDKAYLNSLADVYLFQDDKYKKLCQKHLLPTDENEKENCPVMIVDSRYGKDFAKNIRLSDFSFGQFMQAEEIYLQISNFITKEKPIVDSRTNIEKIVGAGFDKKTSFRNVK